MHCTALSCTCGRRREGEMEGQQRWPAQPSPAARGGKKRGPRIGPARAYTGRQAGMSSLSQLAPTYHSIRPDELQSKEQWYIIPTQGAKNSSVM
ncbi:hypothetical protein VFPPC_18110 [Pochonia chlamydosporia 170]|uniref:Uncharacterized protein n=1 Tax=Pochonia chlamydosporia 170 TaxID=1380566 RepID=A0A219APE6_METCM|nr:hypothetical protein VFPPC_18110 [Pochonia chlamydosporia 170]OWT42697.1 hypothetical protein VFPPC_18110 [Pochonia chlamydosporia 170]